MFIQADIAQTIKSIPWFLDLSKDSIQRLCAIAEVRSFRPGELMFSEGEQHHYFYIVIEGKVCLESYVPGFGAMSVFTAESLDVIGWSSLTPVVRQKPGTARVIEPTKCLTFDSNTLMGLCEADCDLGFVIMRRLANIVASRLLNHRLHLLEIISSQQKQSTQ
jgi:CRP-like cAMP-binding protein